MQSYRFLRLSRRGCHWQQMREEGSRCRQKPQRYGFQNSKVERCSRRQQW